MSGSGLCVVGVLLISSTAVRVIGTGERRSLHDPIRLILCVCVCVYVCVFIKLHITTQSVCVCVYLLNCT